MLSFGIPRRVPRCVPRCVPRSGHRGLLYEVHWFVCDKFGTRFLPVIFEYIIFELLIV